MKTISRSPKNKSVDIFVADFETTTKLSNYYKQNQKGRLILWEVQPLGFESKFVRGVSMYEFENWLLSLKNDTQVFFHNLAKFDGFVLLNWALKHWDNNLQPRYKSKFRYTFRETSHGILSFSVYVKETKRNIIFTDSLKLLSNSIYSLGKVFGFEKLETDYNIDPVNRIEDLPKQFVEYTSRDVSILNRALCLFRDHINTLNKKYKTDILWNNLTIASISRKFIEAFDKDKSFKISAKSQELAKEFYRGGYTSFNVRIQNKEFKKESWFWDAKSHYPSIMVLNKLPHKSPKLIEKHEIDKYNCVFVHVKGVIAYNLNNWATIPLRYNDESYIWTDKEEEFEFKGSLREWLIQDKFYKFKEWEYVRIYGFEETTNCMNSLIKDLYHLKETEPNPLTYKILLNSMYGSCGMKYNYPTKFYVDRGVIPPKDYFVNDKEYIYLNKKKDNFFEKYESYDYLELIDPTTQCWNRWIAAYITSIGRAILQETIAKDPNNAYYCDTDSILTNKNFSGFNELSQGKKLGDWDIDKDNINNLFVQGAKRYVLFEDDENMKKTGFAGLKKETFSGSFKEIVDKIKMEVIDKGQRRLIKDKDWFPFIDDIDYLNRKVLKWNKENKINSIEQKES